jgi:hypothetical protein
LFFVPAGKTTFPMIILTKNHFMLFKDDIVISRHDYINFIDFIRAVCLICRNSQEGTRPLILRMAVGAGPLITGRLR